MVAITMVGLTRSSTLQTEIALLPPPPLRKPLLETFIIIIIIGRRIVYLQSAGVVNTHTHSLWWGREVASHSSGVNCHNFSRNFEQAPVFSINPE